MKTIAQIIAYIITNVIVAQSVFVSEENLVENNNIQLPNTLKFNPSKEIKKSDIPILILNGTKNIQAPIDDAKALHKANPKSKLGLIDNMNQVLKTITKDKDNLKSYYSADYPLPSELVTLIVEIVKE
mgnify:FL=1|tara:strand:- start:9 stop:392 length:384 start_codon:yes stop_codon:yes gene_type:complete